MNNTSLKTRMNTKVQAMEAAQPEDLWNPLTLGTWP